MEEKKMGPGSSSLLLVLVASIWTFKKGSFSIGLLLLKSMGLANFMETPDLVLFIFTYLFTIPAFIMGKKYSEDLGAKTGKVLALIHIIIVSIFIVLYLGSLMYIKSKNPIA